MNQTQQYAHALAQAAQVKNTEEFNHFFDNFIAVLKYKSHLSLLPAILKQVKQLGESQEQANKTLLIVRNAALAGEYANIIDQNSDVFGTDHEVVADPQIVGGYVVRNRTHTIDGSYRTGLLNLYKKLTQ